MASIKLFYQLFGALFQKAYAFFIAIVGWDDDPGPGVGGTGMRNHVPTFLQFGIALSRQVDEDIYFQTAPVAVYEPVHLR